MCITVLEADGDLAWTRSVEYIPEPIPSVELDSIWRERIASFQRFVQLEWRLAADEVRETFVATVPIPFGPLLYRDRWL